MDSTVVNGVQLITISVLLLLFVKHVTPQPSYCAISNVKFLLSFCAVFRSPF